jgi:beta-RFAP synthase
MRAFGGVGLMIDRPGVVVTAAPDRQWSAEGPHAERALNIARSFLATLPERERGCFRIGVERCPPEHVGLGVGTSLGLAVAKAVASELGHGEWDAVELAGRIGRGRRSAIGIHGFQHGGLIVEAGKLPGEAIAPLIGRYEFPEEWRIALFVPDQPSTWHDQREGDVMARLRIGNDTETLCRIVLTGLLPALTSKDFGAFSQALSEFNLRAGRAFEIEQEGILGAGQSSWGPTIWAILPDENRTEALRNKLAARNEFRSCRFWECRAARCGAR